MSPVLKGSVGQLGFPLKLKRKRETEGEYIVFVCACDGLHRFPMCG